MDALRQQRGPLRSALTKTANALDEKAASAEPDADSLAALLAQLEDKGSKLSELDGAIKELLQKDGCSQEDYDREFEAVDVYTNRLISCKSKANRVLAKYEQGQRSERTQVTGSDDQQVPKQFDADLP